LYLSAGDRNRAAYYWDKTGHCGLGEKCRFDHVLLKIEDDETTNFKTDPERHRLAAVHDSR